MDYDKNIIKELREYDGIFAKATNEELKHGFEISKTIKEFDHPENYLSRRDLFLLSQYFAYKNIVESKEAIEEDYIFDEEDLD